MRRKDLRRKRPRAERRGVGREAGEAVARVERRADERADAANQDWPLPSVMAPLR